MRKLWTKRSPCIVPRLSCYKRIYRKKNTIIASKKTNTIRQYDRNTSYANIVKTGNELQTNNNINSELMITKIKTDILENQKQTLDILMNKMKTDVLDFVISQNETIVKMISDNTQKIDAIASHFKLTWGNENNGAAI